MRKTLLTLMVLMIVAVFAGCTDSAETTSPSKKKSESPAQSAPVSAKDGEDLGGCDPRYQALYDQAQIEVPGQGEGEVLIISDPLCWHCRLANKLMGEYSDLFGSYRLSFFPRRSFIGSDMAAWILEDAVGTDRLKKLLDFAYTDLKKAKTTDLETARMLMLIQFTKAFPELVEGTTIEKLYEQLQLKHELHVLKSAQLAKDLHLPGTPVLVVGKRLIVGFGPEEWIKALKEKSVCP
ncbi:DsbA family protein [Pseudodesulfovibrio sediminis]|uniref:Thioredoxin-like fold domain-containing protein n=1 Tax=Pseudodesulfovibrio sediminis TaxID=2810563 RepID=A0ABM7PAC7_9BACT|nr:hypothetical protein [Pseudodesulfovibrio sediminis]BCS90065.1 hypothetical protein PSDVSF_33070 [Pseudodesulfovibrio sediminis]